MSNAPAFPQGHPEMTIQGQTEAETQGMTMRQYYKAMAMQALLNSTKELNTARALGGNTPDELVVARLAGMLADAMLKEDEEHGD